ncbi:uncharacterized protein MONOS_18536 [Monocercomonoides exilis]|uniref:uncharacterized protein n=1 Tax=Monocercomonoides exilis TaxID=2049356 RepID=UPI0035596C78|nr:hypothetical protein MONOS_18536 [Monocercomonoides exilis]
MIIDENEKKEEKNEKFLIDLCECYLLLHTFFLPNELLPICISCLLKAASSKEKNEETQKEVEMALLSLRKINSWDKANEELYLNEIKRIIQHHQEHRNLSHLAYQSAWEFFIYKLNEYKCLEVVIVDDLHFKREESKELEKLSKNVDWKKKGKERGRIKRSVHNKEMLSYNQLLFSLLQAQ